MGVGKSLMLYTFKSATNKVTTHDQTRAGEVETVVTTQSSKADPGPLNVNLGYVKCPYEFSRNTRDIDHATFKGEEYRNFMLFYFPLTWEMFPTQAYNVKLWKTIGFLTRAYTLPDEEYRMIRGQYLIQLQSLFVKLIRVHHGKWCCTYNIHLVLHLHYIREKWGPLWVSSAFLFESMFAQMTRAFKVGTWNVMAQLFENMYSRLLASHACRKTIYIGPNLTQDTANDDSLFYTWNEEDGYEFYTALTVFHWQSGVQAYKISVDEVPETRGDQYPWHKVGLFQYGVVHNADQSVHVPAAKVKGKAIQVDNYIMSIANGLLRESGKVNKKAFKATQDTYAL